MTKDLLRDCSTQIVEVLANLLLLLTSLLLNYERKGTRTVYKYGFKNRDNEDKAMCAVMTYLHIYIFLN